MKERIEQIITNLIELDYNGFDIDKLIAISKNAIEGYRTAKYLPLVCGSCDTNCHTCKYNSYDINNEIDDYFNSHIN